jgi:hypothetical protein
MNLYKQKKENLKGKKKKKSGKLAKRIKNFQH